VGVLDTRRPPLKVSGTLDAFGQCISLQCVFEMQLNWLNDTSSTPQPISIAEWRLEGVGVILIPPAGMKFDKQEVAPCWVTKH